MLKRRYLTKGDRCFAAGMFVVFDDDYSPAQGNFRWKPDGFEDDLYFDGHCVAWDRDDRPYIEMED